MTDEMKKALVVDAITLLRQEPILFADALANEHRTHQQSTVGSIVTVLRMYGEARYGTDLRNEASVAWAAKVTADNPRFPMF